MVTEAGQGRAPLPSGRTRHFPHHRRRCHLLPPREAVHSLHIVVDPADSAAATFRRFTT